MQRNLTFQPITMPYFKYADIATTKKLDKIKTLKYGGFPDIAGCDEPISIRRCRYSGDWISIPRDSVAAEYSVPREIFRLVENGLYVMFFNVFYGTVSWCIEPLENNVFTLKFPERFVSWQIRTAISYRTYLLLAASGFSATFFVFIMEVF